MKNYDLVPRLRLFLCMFFLVGFANSAQAQSVTLSATSHTFGSVAVSATSGTSTVRLTNGGTVALSITSIVPSGDFAETHTCVSPVAAGRSCLISITFKPTAIGTRTGAITITDNASPGTQRITLQGTGTAPVTVSPSSRTFGSVAIGQTSSTHTFTITNRGTAARPLTITPSAEFGEKDTCNGSLAGGASCIITATFTPAVTASGLQTGTIRIAYDISSTSVSVQGTAIAPVAVSPTSITFSTSLHVGVPSNPHTVTITNRETIPLAIKGIVASPASYAVTANTCGSSLAASSSCTVTVVFTPAVAGTIPGTLTISDGAVGSPQTVPMTGAGVLDGLVSVAISVPSATLAKGTQEQLRAIGTYGNGRTGDVTGNSTWTSSSPGIASVSATGVATGVSPGPATITAAVTGTTVTGNTSLTVTPPSLKSVAVSAPPASLAVAATSQFTATGTYSDGSTGALPTAVFSSSNTVAATITTAGLATGVAVGTSNITAALNGITSPAVTLTVVDPSPTLQSIVVSATQSSITPASPLLAKGTSQQLYATGVYTNNSTLDLTTQVSWSSNSPDATVSNVSGSQGLVTGSVVGPATITATLGLVSGNASLTVTPAILKSIAISPTTITTWSLGQTQQFTAMGTFTDATTQDLTATVAWSSSNTAVATIIGTTAGLATSVGQGQVTISAATAGVPTASTQALTVGPAALTSITITPPNPSIALGTSQLFTATGNYTDGTTANLTSSVTWSATPNPSGAATFILNTAKATTQGIVTITATPTSGPAGTTLLTITASALTSIVVAPASAKIYQGASQQFTATGTFSDGTTQDITATVAWSTSSGATATIGTAGATAGLATSVGAGVASISATSGLIVSTTTGGDGSLTVVGISSIGITPANPTLPLGDANPLAPYGATNNTAQFTATVTYTDAITSNVTNSALWSSANTAVAAIAATGQATLLTAGTSTITATYASVPGTTLLTVSPAVLESISISAPATSIAVAATSQFTATGTYSDGSAGALPTAVFSSSNTVAATITTAGLATGVGGGTSNITAALNGITSPSVTLTVIPPPPTLQSIVVSATQSSITPASPLLAKGTSQQLYATGVYTNNSTLDLTTQVSWSSNSPDATVSNVTGSQGLVTGSAVGPATITATLGLVSGNASLTVTPAILKSIAISPTTLATWSLGQTQQFTAMGTFTDATTQDLTATVTWSSSNTAVATIIGTTAGLATSVGQGQVIISAATAGVPTVSTQALTVGPAALTSITITPPNPSIALGTTQLFTATGNYTDGTTANLTSSVTWSATPNPSGAATFTLNTAKATTQGIVTITATPTSGPAGTTLLTITAPVLTSIMVAPASAKIYQGASQQFTATGTFSDGTTQDITATVTWGTNNGTVATISTSGATGGLATSVGAGVASISATSGLIVSTATGGDGNLTVIGISSIGITPANPALPLGDANPSAPFGATNNTVQFTATVTYTDSVTSNVTNSAVWTSANTAVAAIAATGQATLLTAGTSTITATYASVPGTTLLTVSPAVLESITVAPTGVSLGLNGTQQFTATGTYSDSSTGDVTNTATWTSFNPQIVTVGTAGTTPASTPGLATVVAATNVAVAITASSGTVAPYGSTNTAFVSALSTLPVVCPTETIDMKLLVVNNASANGGAGYADLPAIQRILNYLGTPYDVVDALSSALPKLSDGACHGFYQGIIFAFGDDIYSNPPLYQALTSYEQTFGVRQLNWYTNPTPDFGFNYSSTFLLDTQTDTLSFTAAAQPVFYYANVNTPLTITNAFAYLTTPLAPSGGTVTPLLVDPSGNTLSGITQFADGRQYLTQMFDSNAFLTHDLVVAYGLVNWVTKGIFLGDYHVYAVAQVDDFFINDSEWIPATPCTNPITHDRTPPDAASLPVFRIDATNDMAAVVAWQKQKQSDPLLSQFELTLAFNGVGTTGNRDWTGLPLPGITNTAAISATNPNGVVDDLVYNLSSYQQFFRWITHTYDHPSTLNGLHKSDSGGDVANNPPVDSIDLEILTNLYVAGNSNGLQLDQDPSDTTPAAGTTGGVNPHTFTDFNPANAVTPGVTGLNDPNSPIYLYQDGIRYVVTDTSVIGQTNNGPNPSPNVGIVNSYAPGIYEVPRHPNDVFYNAANWADDHAEFSCIYNNPVDPPFNTYSAAQILDFVSSNFVTNMLIGDMDPQMFHQPNLHFSDNGANLGLSSSHISSLLSDTYDTTFSKYEALYQLPVLSPTLDQLATNMQNRNGYNLSGVTASLIGVPGAQTIRITMPPTAGVSSATIPVSGLKSNGAELYGGKYISHINMSAGQTVVFTVQ